jgi:hypothetical protein
MSRASDVRSWTMRSSTASPPIAMALAVPNLSLRRGSRHGCLLGLARAVAEAEAAVRLE